MNEFEHSSHSPLLHGIRLNDPVLHPLLLLPMASPSGSHSFGTNPFGVGNEHAPPPASTLVLLNIRSHIPVVLNADDGNFRQWRSFFELTLKKFGLFSHIDGTVDAAAIFDDLECLQLDSCVVSWLYNTVSKEI